MLNKNEFCIKLIHCGNISLVNPADRQQKNIFFLPMGSFALAGHLKQSGIDAEIIHSDLEIGRRLEEILDFSRIDAVGFDCHWLNQSYTVLETAARVKEINPRVFVFLGGYSASLFAEEILTTYNQVDAIIRGDAEVPIVELCAALQGRLPMAKVANLAWKTKDRELVINDFTYIATPGDLDKLDFAAFDLLRNFERYRAGSAFWTSFSPLLASPLFLLEVGRGCQAVCTFCGGNCLAQKRMNNRQATSVRSVDSTLATIKKAISYGYETFFTCLEFQDSDRWFLELFRRIGEEKLPVNFTYGGWGLPSNALIDALSNISTHSILEISPETANMHLRRKNKDPRLFYTNDQLEETLSYAATKKNMIVQLYFGYYLSGDTEQTIMETFRYILKLVLKYPNLLEIEYSNFSTDPGSLLFFNPDRYQVDMTVKNFADFQEHLKKYYLLQEGQAYDMTLFRPWGISRHQEKQLLGKIQWLNDLFRYFRKSASYLLLKINSPDVILNFAAETAPSIGKYPTETAPVEIQDSLLNYCSRHNILDDVLIRLIAFESEKNRSVNRLLYFSSRFYLDTEINTVSSIKYESLTRYIGSQLNAAPADENFEIEFNL